MTRIICNFTCLNRAYIFNLTSLPGSSFKVLNFDLASSNSFDTNEFNEVK